MEFAETLEKLEIKLRKIAGNVTDNKADQDDLLQEGWLHLWKNREKLKNKTISYLLTGCYFRFIDYLKRGSSVDSKSRENVTVISLYDRSDKGRAPLISSVPSKVEDVKDALIAKDSEEQIRKRLNAKLRETYDFLLMRHTLGEIAKRLNLTHEAVRLRVKRIRRIAKEYLERNLDFQQFLSCYRKQRATFLLWICQEVQTETFEAIKRKSIRNYKDKKMKLAQFFWSFSLSDANLSEKFLFQIALSLSDVAQSSRKCDSFLS